MNLKKYKSKQEIQCNICGSKEYKTLFKETRFNTGVNVVICKKCGLVYLNPRWNEKDYSNFYKEDYRRLMNESKISLEESHIQERIHGSSIVDFCGDYIKKGDKVLDIGSSSGGTLWAFNQSKECDAIGVEPSIDRSEFVRKKYGFKIFTGLFEEIDFKVKDFDLVIITQTLNHLLDPKETLKRIHDSLKENGLLFIEVQNFYAFDKFALKSTQVDHTYYFFPETIETLLKKIGYEYVKVEVDNEKSAKEVPSYMWHKGAFIHIRILARKKDAKKRGPLVYPNYLPFYKYLRRNHFRNIPKRLISSMIHAIRRTV